MLYSTGVEDPQYEGRGGIYLGETETGDYIVEVALDSGTIEKLHLDPR